MLEVLQMKKSYLKSIYKYDQAKESYILEISIENYNELFNAWDASPIRKKDIDPDLAEYLNQVGVDIPLKEKIDIIFILPKKLKNEAFEAKAIKAFHNYFNANIHFVNRTLKINLRKVFAYLMISFMFITVAYVANTKNLALSFDIMKEGLFIGGWVFMWEAFSLFFFSTSEIYSKKRRFQRFAKIDIHFKYSDE